MKSALRVLRILGAIYKAPGAVDLGNPRDTLIATLLSARTRDDQVLKIYPAFKKKFPTWDKLAKAQISSIATSVKSVNFYRTKAKNIKKLAQMIVKDFKGKVPSKMEDLLKLPGVGRKTASCVISYEFKKPAIAVDTHVFRVAHRLGWSKSPKRDSVESDLRKILPQKQWNEINRTFVPFGREICKPQKPLCYKCPIVQLCKFPHKNLKQ